MSCTDLAAGSTLGEILMCSIDLATGSRLLTSLLVFTVFVYAMYKLRMPFIVSVPLGTLLIFVFAGAGILSASAAPVFTNLMWIILIVFGIILVFAAWRLRR